MREAYTVAWWVPAGHEPTVDEAMARLTALREHGPSKLAFTLQWPYPPADPNSHETAAIAAPGAPV